MDNRSNSFQWVIHIFLTQSKTNSKRRQNNIHLANWDHISLHYHHHVIMNKLFMISKIQSIPPGNIQHRLYRVQRLWIFHGRYDLETRPTWCHQCGTFCCCTLEKENTKKTIHKSLLQYYCFNKKKTYKPYIFQSLTVPVYRLFISKTNLEKTWI